MLRKNLKMDFTRALKSGRFLLAVLLLFLVWQINRQRFQIASDVVYIYVTVWGRSITSLLALVVTAVAYVNPFCEDFDTHFLRYHILRTGLRCYVISKIIVCFCASFLVCVLGSLAFLIYQSIFLPLLLPETITSLGTSCGSLLPEHVILYLGVQLFLHGLLCGSLSVLALGLSVFVRHTMGVYVLPFLLDFIFLNILSDLSTDRAWLDINCVFDLFMSGSNNAAVHVSYALFVTVLFLISAYGIMYRKLKGVFR